MTKVGLLAILALILLCVTRFAKFMFSMLVIVVCGYALYDLFTLNRSASKRGM